MTLHGTPRCASPIDGDRNPSVEDIFAIDTALRAKGTHAGFMEILHFVRGGHRPDRVRVYISSALG